MRIIAAIAILLASPAAAHDWYPMECCSGIDCAPVDQTQWVAGAAFVDGNGEISALPVMMVTTKHGTALVPQRFPHRQSPDGQMHACIRGGHLICLFVPPNS